MKQYLAVYTGSPERMAEWQSMPEELRKRREALGIEGWFSWVEKYRASIVIDGGPLGRTKRVSKGGIADVRNNMGAFTVVQAESQEEAARMFEQHPHFTVFYGDGVDVMECLPIPEKKV